jgi:uncharacterized membrane protein
MPLVLHRLCAPCNPALAHRSTSPGRTAIIAPEVKRRAAMAEGEGMSSARLEAFSDGVLAIIITIMVLDLHAPSSGGPSALLALWPTFFSYTLSFFVVAVYWLNHHRTFHLVRRVDTGVLWANILFLFCLSFLPFLTHLMSNMALSAFAVALYAGWMLVCVVAGMVLRLAVLHEGSVDAPARAVMSRGIRKNLLTIFAYAAAAALAYVSPWLGLLIISGTASVYVFPDFGLVRRQRR